MQFQQDELEINYLLSRNDVRIENSYAYYKLLFQLNVQIINYTLNYLFSNK